MAELQRPLPAITPELKPFLDGARQGKLMLQKCDRCGKFRFPIQPLCDKCGSWDATFTPVSGRGEVLSFIVMHQVYHPAFAGRVPYVVVRVSLEEGPLFNANLIGIEPGKVRCGMAVEATFEQIGDDITLPMFRPAK